MTPRDELAKYINQAQLSKYFIDKVKIVSVASYGVTGNGSDESVRVQEAFDEGSVIYFPFTGDEVYSFKDITCDHSVIVLSAGLFKPLHKSPTSNQLENMITVSDCDYAIINATVDGDNSIAIGSQSGTKYNTSSVFLFNNVKKVKVNCDFKDIDGSWRLTAPATWSDRRALANTFIDCEDVKIEGNFTNMGGDEWNWRVYTIGGTYGFTDGVARITNCRFSDNFDVGSAFGVVGGRIYFNNNEADTFVLDGSYVNLFGTHVYIHDNSGYGLNVNSIFDTCEGYNCKNEYVECVNNSTDYASKLTNIGLQCNTRNLFMEGNSLICRNQVQSLAYPAGYADPTVRYSDAATVNTYDDWRILNNRFYDLYDGAEDPEEISTMIVLGRHNDYSRTEGLRMNLCEISGNTIKSIRTNTYMPVYVYLLANTFDVLNNKFESMGGMSGSAITLTYIRVMSTDNTAAVIRVNGNKFDNSNYDITGFSRFVVIASTSTANVYKLYFNNNVSTVVDGSSKPILNEVYNSTVLYGDNNQNFVNYSMPGVASATTTTLPESGDFFNITGTTNITSITASWVGRLVTLKFADILTFTDGNNLKLAGNLSTSADDTITLRCDGTNWYEVCRSVN